MFKLTDVENIEPVQEKSSFKLTDVEQPDLSKMKGRDIANCNYPERALLNVVNSVMGMAGWSVLHGNSPSNAMGNIIYNAAESVLSNQKMIGEYVGRIPETAIGTGIKIGEAVKNTGKFLYERQAENNLYEFSAKDDNDTVGALVSETGRGAASEIFSNTPKMASDIFYWLGKNMQDPIDGRTNSMADSFLSLSKTFANISDYMGDIDFLKSKAGPTQTGRMSLGQAGFALGSGIGQGATMAVMARLFGAKTAYGFYAGAGGAEVFKESYEKDGNLSKANTLAGLNAVTTYMLDRWFDPLPENIATGARIASKEVAKEIAKTVVKEPVTEGLQQVFAENLVRKVGLDTEQDLLEGVIESMIGALGGAAAMGGVSVATAYSAERSYERARQKAIEKGATEAEVEQYRRATKEKLRKHPEAFDVVFQKNLQTTLNDIDNFVRENGNTEEVRKALQTKQELERVYTDVVERLKKAGVDDNVANANAKIWQGIALFGAEETGFSPTEYIKQRMPQITKSSYGQFRSRDLNEALNDNVPYQLPAEAYNMEGQADISAPAFKKWFVNSKVLDEKGQPLMVYHGTPYNFEAFDKSYLPKPTASDPGFYGQGFYFSKNRFDTLRYTRGSGNVMPVYLSIQNPLVLNDIYYKHMRDIPIERIKELGIYKKGLEAGKFSGLTFDEYVTFNHLSKRLSDNAKAKGYDGIFAGDEYVVFEPNQIKSVYNRGTFDSSNDNIYYQGQISLETVRKAREVKAALERIASGSAEETVKNLRNDLEQYGGTNDVTFVFGDEKKGIRHIAEKHGVKTLLKVFDAVVDGDVSKFVKGKKTVHLSKDGVEAVLSLDENGNKKTWLLTGFDTKISPDEEREFRATLNSTQSKPTFSRQELGAELNSYIISNDTGDVNNTLYQGQIAENVVNMPTVEEFKNPVKDYELPRLNKSDLRRLGKEDKPVVLKKNIIEKNKRNHPEVDISEYNRILTDTLINTSEIIQVQPQRKPNYYTFINENQNDVSVVELSENKDNYEVINFFKVNKKRIDKYRKKAVKDGGDIIITERKPQGAARLSALLNSDTNNITPTRENVNNTLDQGLALPKGAYVNDIDIDTNKVIYLFEKADASTFMHETAHFFKEELKRFGTARSREMLKKVNEWENSQFDQRYRIEEENGKYAVTDKLGMVIYDNFDSVERARKYGKSEIFARGFEQYLREGRAPNNYLKQAFRSFWNWLRKLYKTASDLNVELNDDIRSIYGEIIGGKDLDFYLQAPVDEVLQQHFEEQKERKDYLDEQISIAQAQPVKKSFAANLAQEKTDGAKGRNEWWSKAIIPISTRAKRINQGLKNRLRAYDFSLANKLNAYYAEIKPFLDKWATMTEQDAVAFDLALKNSYMEKQLEIVKRYDAYDEFVKVKNLLNSLFDQAIDFGIDMGYTADYFPRQIKDVDGFMSYIYGSPMSSQLRRALREADPDNVMKPEERAEFLNKYLRGFNRRDLNKPLPGNTKDRKIDIVTAALNQYYAPSMEALISYIEGMNTAIESRRFWGFKYDDINRSIGAFTAQMIDDGLIRPEQDAEVQEILKARFNARGVHSGWLNWHKNMAYIYTMGGINSAITQIEDMSMSLYKAGLWNTVQSVFSKNRQGLSREELGLEKIGQEFAEASASSKLVSAIFKATGLDKIDAFGKNTLINATFNKFQKMAKNNEAELRARIEPVMEQETGQTIEDIKNGVISENVKLLMFNELADVQPIALSEMPEWYLTSGNGRVFYMLKSFALKRIDIFRNECFDKMRNGQVKKGLQNLFRLAMLMMICGASKDMLIDLLYGRDVELSETFINNLLGLTGIVNKYSLYKLRDEGFSGILSAQIPPIFPLYSDLVGDVYKSLFTKKGKDVSDYEVWKGLPLIGRFYYWWLGGGRTKLEKKNKKTLR